MKRIFDPDILPIPAYLVSVRYDPLRRDETWRIRVLPFAEPLSEPEVVPSAEIKSRKYALKQYPQVEFDMIISDQVLHEVERHNPRFIELREELLNPRIREERTKQYNDERKLLQRGVAKTIYDLWLKKAASVPESE